MKPKVRRPDGHKATLSPTDAQQKRTSGSQRGERLGAPKVHLQQEAGPSAAHFEVDPDRFDDTMKRLRHLIGTLPTHEGRSHLMLREKDELPQEVPPPFSFLCALYGLTAPHYFTFSREVARGVIEGMKGEQSKLARFGGKSYRPAKSCRGHVAALEATLDACEILPVDTVEALVEINRLNLKINQQLNDALHWCINAFYLEPRGPLWASWQPLFAQQSLTPAQAAVLGSLGRDSGVDLNAGEQSCQTLLGLTVAQREPQKMWASCDANVLTRSSYTVSASPLGAKTL